MVKAAASCGSEERDMVSKPTPSKVKGKGKGKGKGRQPRCDLHSEFHGKNAPGGSPAEVEPASGGAAVPESLGLVASGVDAIEPAQSEVLRSSKPHGAVVAGRGDASGDQSHDAAVRSLRRWDGMGWDGMGWSMVGNRERKPLDASRIRWRKEASDVVDPNERPRGWAGRGPFA